MMCTDWLIEIKAVGILSKNKAPTTKILRPNLSDKMPTKGDKRAMPITVAPTIMPACTSLAFKS